MREKPLLLYFFRKRDSGYSIESLFGQLATHFRTQNKQGMIKETCIPHMELNPYTLWANLRYASRQKATIYQITGDVHYLMLALPPASTVLTIHDCVSLVRQQRAGNTLKFRLLWLLYYYLPMQRAQYITTVSEKSRQELLHYMGPALAHKVRVIPNHYNPRLKAAPKEFNSLKPAILHIGTASHKNLPRLIEALSTISCSLTIIGTLSASQRQQLDQLGLTYVTKECLSEDEMITEYHACDLVAFTSVYEGFGMPIVEANAVGRPVVTSLLSPMHEVGGEAACLVDPYSVESIREGVLRVVTDAAYRNQLIEAGYRNASKYTIEQAAAQYEALYQQITG